VIFAQLVDDRSAHPDLFSTEKKQEKERERLFKIIEDLVLWENTNARVGDRDAEDVFPVAGGARVGDGGLAPDRGSHIVEKSGSLHLALEPGAEDARECLHRHEEVGTRGDPLAAVLAPATRRHGDVEMRVVGQLPAPDVEHGGEAEARAEEARVAGEVLERTRSGAEERGVGDASMGTHERPEFVGERDRSVPSIPVPQGAVPSLCCVASTALAMPSRMSLCGLTAG
jgi:hypothetical protein